jgi:outer membrane protein assembly factor BamB
VAWKAELPPGGNSACALNGTVYTMGSDNTLRAFDPLTGRPLWKLERPGEARQQNYLEPGPKRLYAAGEEGTIVCLDPTHGRPLWATSLVGPLESAPCQAPDGSLLVAGRGGLLYSLNPDDGERNWVARVSKSGYLTARPVTDGTSLYAGTAEGRLLALDVATGDQKWDVQVGQGCVNPALCGDGVAVGTSEGRVLGYANGKETWRFQGGPEDRFTAPVQAGDVTVATCGTYAIGLIEGREIWRVERSLAPVSPTLDPSGRVILASKDGSLDVVEPGTGRPVWQASAGSEPLGSVVPGPDGSLLHASKTALCALVEDDVAWTQARAESPLRSAVVEGEQTILVGGIRLKRRGC